MEQQKRREPDQESRRTKDAPVAARDPLSGAPLRIGVMGSAGGVFSADIEQRCTQLGIAIAKRGCCVLTGACPGLPHVSVCGARGAGGATMGISPGTNLKEHVERFESPFAEYDTLVFTGLGLMGRELINIRSSDIIIIVGGRSGTLGEFAIAYEEGKLIGVLSGTGGITDSLAVILPTVLKETGAEVLFDEDPVRLVKNLVDRYLSGNYHCPCYPTPVAAAHVREATRPCSCCVEDGSLPTGEDTGT